MNCAKCNKELKDGFFIHLQVYEVGTSPTQISGWFDKGYNTISVYAPLTDGRGKDLTIPLHQLSTVHCHPCK